MVAMKCLIKGERTAWEAGLEDPTCLYNRPLASRLSELILSRTEVISIKELAQIPRPAIPSLSTVSTYEIVAI